MSQPEQVVRLEPAMPLGGPLEWDGAEWVGALDVAALPDDLDDVRIQARRPKRFASARLLVRDGDEVLGFLSVSMRAGALDREEVAAGVRDLRGLGPSESDGRSDDVAAQPAVTVIVCTRDRPELLRAALDSIVALDYPDVEVVVVDNAPTTTRTRDLIRRRYAQHGVRYVLEPRAGLSRARNAGVRAAHGEVVAFTDDDVVVDAGWLRGIARGFARGEDVQLVSGLVPSGELRTAVQAYFDGRVSWSANTATRVYRLSERPEDLPMFPFSVGQFGTGANFAIRRALLLRLGGFDTALGAGTRTKGGEDLDMFVRVLFGRGAIAIEPSAVVWHRHRSDLPALRDQAIGYGRGLGAWLTTVVLHPRMLALALRRSPEALSRLMAKGGGTVTRLDGERAEVPEDLALEIDRVGRAELRQVAVGPWAYAVERWRGAGQGESLRDDPAPRSIDAIVDRPVVAAAAAVIAGLCGILLVATVLVAPGSAVLAWARVPRSLAPIAVPGVGIVLVLLWTGIASQVPGWWNVPAVSLVLGGASALAGAIALVVQRRDGFWKDANGALRRLAGDIAHRLPRPAAVRHSMRSEETP